MRVGLHVTGLLLVVAAGCTETSTEPAPVPSSITVTQSALSFDVLGSETQTSATVLDQNGTAMTAAQAPISWVSSDAGVASVSQTGVVTAEGVGSADVTASAGTVAASIDVIVETVPDTLNLDATQYGVSGSDIVGLPVSVAKGTFSATLIQGTYVAWSFAFGGAGTWRTHFAIFLQDSTTVSGGDTLNEDNADSAFAATTNTTVQFTVPDAQSIELYVPDNVLTDNIGWVSIELRHIRR